MEIDNRHIDREEERQTERKKNESRQDLERKMKYEPMKTFEAKLSEKTAHETLAKDSALRDAHNLKKSKEEKDSFLNKILGVTKDGDVEKEKSRVSGVHEQLEQEFEEAEQTELRESEFEVAEDDDEALERSESQESKDTEYSTDGHKRVAEKQQGESSGGFGGSAGGEDGGASGQNQSHSEKDEAGFGSSKHETSLGVSQAHKVSAVAKSAFGMGFDNQARRFSHQNLDEMVAAVQLGINEQGEHEFSIELSDDYFCGLKVIATRTEDGVVLKFKCPNAQVRSTFLKFRPTVYAHFKLKKIQIKRIEVV